MVGEKFFNTVAEAFQIGNKDLYSDLRKKLKKGGAELWLDSLERQRNGEVKDRYAEKYRKRQIPIENFKLR